MSKMDSLPRQSRDTHKLGIAPDLRSEPVAVSAASHCLGRARSVPPLLFLLGTLLAPLAAFIVYWGIHGTRWYQSLSAAYQLLGILVAFWQVAALRKELRRAPISALILHGLKPEKPVVGALLASETGGDTARITGHIEIPSLEVVPLEEQVRELRAELLEMKNHLASAAAELQAHKGATASALSELRSSTGQQVRQLWEEIAQAVTSSPFVATFGVWLVIVGTWMQLVMALWH